MTDNRLYKSIGDGDRRIVTITLAHFNELPHETLLYNVDGYGLRKGVGWLRNNKPFEASNGFIAVPTEGGGATHLGFKARPDDPDGEFTAPYRNS